MTASPKAARTALAAHLADALPDATVITAPVTVDQVTAPTVLVGLATPDLTQQTSCSGVCRVPVTLLVGDFTADPAALADALDDLWWDTVTAVGSRAVTDTDLEVYAGRWPARTLTVEVVTSTADESS